YLRADHPPGEALSRNLPLPPIARARDRARQATALIWPTTVVVAYVVAIGAAYRRCVRFDADTTPYWQARSGALLRGRPLDSLGSLHIQPPLFNAFLGAGLQTGGAHSDVLFAALYLGLGLCLGLAIYDTLSRLRVARPLATVAALLLVANPSVILFQNILFYP